MNSSGDMWVPWQAQTTFTSFLPNLYVTPDMVLPFGPDPVVETKGRSGYDPHPPNLTFGAMPGLMAEPISGDALSVFSSSTWADEEAPPSAIHKNQ
jgi:hypothetical protein